MKVSSDRRPEPFDAEVGARVRAIRKSRGISQGVLAQAVGITFQQVQKYERGTNRISCSMLKHISEHLGVSMSELLGEALAAGTSSTDWSFLTTPGAAELGRAYASIQSPTLRRRLLELVVQLAYGEDKPGS